jgi:hypothetical protein
MISISNRMMVNPKQQMQYKKQIKSLKTNLSISSHQLYNNKHNITKTKNIHYNKLIPKHNSNNSNIKTTKSNPMMNFKHKI